MLRPLLLVLALLATSQAHPQTTGTASSAAASSVRAFHDALRTGDTATVERLLAPDAVILEGGDRESREEYLSRHLKADIEFAKAVTTRTDKVVASVKGDVAWVSSTSVSTGSFRDRPVNLVGAELVVLTRKGSEWLIEAVHWSSRQGK